MKKKVSGIVAVAVILAACAAYPIMKFNSAINGYYKTYGRIHGETVSATTRLLDNQTIDTVVLQKTIKAESYVLKKQVEALAPITETGKEQKRLLLEAITANANLVDKASALFFVAETKKRVDQQYKTAYDAAVNNPFLVPAFRVHESNRHATNLKHEQATAEFQSCLSLYDDASRRLNEIMN